jgi:hypothetical protein
MLQGEIWRCVQMIDESSWRADEDIDFARTTPQTESNTYQPSRALRVITGETH